MCAGVKNADENELRAIASPPEETHMYNVADFSVMSSIVEGVTRSVCERVSELSKEISGGFLGVCGISDALMLASVTVIFTEKYLIKNMLYLSFHNILLGWCKVCLRRLCASGETEPYSRSLDAPSDLVTSEVTARSFRVSWTHAAGPVEKYRVVYYSSSGSRPEEVCVFVYTDEDHIFKTSSVMQ